MGARDYAPQSSATTGRLEGIIRRHEAALLAIPGVVMITRGLPEPGVEVIIVGVDDAKVLARLPKELEGIRVHGEVTGPIEAL